MALLVTSCTMGKQPDRLLNKGAQYFRERTNTAIFANRRKSAVELLQATRDQYVKSSQLREQSHKSTDDIHQAGRTSPGSLGTKRPSRSKSEYDIVKLLQDRSEDECPDELDSDRTDLLVHTKQRSGQVSSLHGASPQKINTSGRNNETTISSVRRKICALEVNNSNPAIGRSPKGNNKQLLHSDSSENQMDISESKTAQESQTTPPSNHKPNDALHHGESDCSLPVHRSQSDMSCSHHSRRDSQISENSGRSLRASANLEKFFNEMGLEKSVLDPMLRRQELLNHRDLEYFESVSSLDSPDNRSISSGVSRSDKGHSDDGADKNLQHTSVIERNARIIKWLCNVKKAKYPQPTS